MPICGSSSILLDTNGQLGARNSHKLFYEYNEVVRPRLTWQWVLLIKNKDTIQKEKKNNMLKQSIVSDEKK